MPLIIDLLLALACAAAPARAVHVSYTLRADARDPGAFAVRMQVTGAPASFVIAAAAHPEYDDKYWRYLVDMQVANGTAERLDSVRWQVRAPPGEAVISYRVRPPVVSGLRAAWRAFLTPAGGLLGGPHSFLYVLGQEGASAAVLLDLPAGWQSASALESAGPGRYAAADMAELLDSPIIVGPGLSRARFVVEGVPHDVVYWGMPGGVPFDTATFRSGIERLVRANVAFWGSMPYRRYTFIYEDGAYGGGLEHRSSVTLGAPSEELAHDPLAAIRETAHEYFHTWNLMRIRPAEYRDVDYRVQPPVPGLWFSEGLTMFYADLLARRAGLPAAQPTRAEHLALLIARYLSNSGNSRHSAEEISRYAYNAPTGALGDFQGSAHLHGELIGNLLDMQIRAATNGARSMDDFMRLLLLDPASRRVRGADIEAAVRSVCGCDPAPVFDAYVRGAQPMDFDRYLGLLGMRATVSRAPALRDGRPAPDLRIRALQEEVPDTLVLLFWDPASAWVTGGLHTGDRLLALNGRPVRSWPEVAAQLGPLQIGDSARFDIVRAGVPRTVAVRVAGYDAVSVRVESVKGATAAQRRLRAAWEAGS